jgi:hypothetical protein
MLILIILSLFLKYNLEQSWFITVGENTLYLRQLSPRNLPTGESTVDFRQCINELSPVANVLLAKRR